MAVIAALDRTDLRGVALDGVINEELMQKIWNISKIPLPFTDMVGSGRVQSHQYDWVTDKLAAGVATNAWVETANFSTTTATGVTDYADSAAPPAIRYRNHIQISVKAVSVSEVSEAVSSVGGSGGLAYQLMHRQQELRRDVETYCLSNNASVAGNSTTTAPKTASYVAGCKDQTVPTRNLVNTAGTEGGYNSGTGVFAAYTPGTARAISETMLRSMALDLYLGGCGGPNQQLVLMTAPTLKQTISTYMYTSTARIASLVRDVQSADMAAAQGAVDIFITDFGILKLVPNRFMGDLGTNQYAALMFDPDYYELVYLRGYTTSVNAKIGLVDRRTMSVYWGTRFNPECMGAILDINPASAMIA